MQWRLSSILNSYVEKPSVVVCTCNFRAWQVGRLRGLLACQSNRISLWESVRPFLQKQGGKKLTKRFKKISKVDFHTPPTCTHAQHMYKQAHIWHMHRDHTSKHVRMYTWTQTQTHKKRTTAHSGETLGLDKKGIKNSEASFSFIISTCMTLGKLILS